MKIELPEKVRFILNTLMEAGYEAYAVGGCVRDSILGRTPQDWDVTTSAEPLQIKELFRKTIDTGIQHGTVTVMVDQEGFEVTTYRIDGEYEDARHPKEVVFTRNLTEDLKRRDFTINAMAYNEKDGLVDAFDGLGDMQRQVIRCVGEPRERFGEDALRMLRAVRFSAQLGFSIDSGTRRAIEELAPNLKKISAERIRTELGKLLISDHPDEVRTLYAAGISREIFPWLDRMMETPQNNPYHCCSVGEHSIRTLMYVEPDRVLRLTMLLHDMAKPDCRTTDSQGKDHFYGHPGKSALMAKKVMQQLKFDNDTIDRVCSLIQWHDDNPVITPANIRKAVYRVGLRQYPALFSVKRADIMGKSSYRQAEMLAYVTDYEEEYRKIRKAADCLSLKDLAVKGEDLIRTGMKPGKEIGEALSWLLMQVLEHPEDNTRETLLKKLSERA